MLPTFVILQAKVDLNKWAPFWSFGFADQVQTGFGRRAVGLPHITFDARADDVLP